MFNNHLGLSLLSNLALHYQGWTLFLFCSLILCVSLFSNLMAIDLGWWTMSQMQLSWLLLSYYTWTFCLFLQLLSSVTLGFHNLHISFSCLIVELYGQLGGFLSLCSTLRTCQVMTWVESMCIQCIVLSLTVNALEYSKNT